MTSDRDLLRTFAETRDAACFTCIVQRHIKFVYGVCWRRLGNAHLAQDATQTVFIALARKAGAVATVPNVLGWLHRSACYETRNLMRAQANRLARETEAHRLGTTGPEGRPHLPILETVLDDALGEIPTPDRDAILARFFAERSYREIGAELKVSENAARMRVERALIKLRDCLGRRGVTSTAAILASALPSYASGVTLPVGIAATVSQAAVAGAGVTAGVSTLISFMSSTKIAIGGVVALAAATGTLWVQSGRATKELRHELAQARSETVASRERLAALRSQLEELRQERSSAATTSVSFAQHRAVPADDKTEAPPPPPGVTPEPPPGWFANGNAKELYEVGVDENNSWGGMPSAYARSIGDTTDKFGGMMQTIAADSFKNQRVRLTGWVKTEDVTEGAHLWLRVDGSSQGSALQFDNMQKRAPKGTTDWEEYSVVLDVPDEATRVNYGFFVSGQGQMWVNGLTITPVGNDVPSTNMLTPKTLPPTPVNLGFAPPKSG